MEPIKLTGWQIVDSKRMKQSGRRRLWIELTESDTKLYGAALVAWEDNEVIIDSELKPTEIQGNDNGYERSIEKPKEESIYQRFKRKCIEYSGEDYYERLKKHLSVERMRQLENKDMKDNLKGVLMLQELYLEAKKLKMPHDEACAWTTSNYGASSDYGAWMNLFNSFNNPQI